MYPTLPTYLNCFLGMIQRKTSIKYHSVQQTGRFRTTNRDLRQSKLPTLRHLTTFANLERFSIIPTRSIQFLSYLPHTLARRTHGFFPRPFPYIFRIFPRIRNFPDDVSPLSLIIPFECTLSSALYTHKIRHTNAQTRHIDCI